MEILTLTQGSDEWLKIRLEHLTASEAPVIMGISKFMSRNQLLDLKKGWQSAPDDVFKKRLYQKGHEYEEAARAITEIELCDELPAVVGRIVIDGLELLASFDGYSECSGVWEHKSWNKVLPGNVRNKVLEPLYYWQLEHQALVAGTDSVMFTVSDGTEANRETMIYDCVPERREELIANCKQFLIDLDNHQLTAKEEAVVANNCILLPVVYAEVNGAEISTNLPDYLGIIKTMAQDEISRRLESDQDFADKDQLNKEVKSARAALKAHVANVEDKFVSYAEFAKVAKEADAVLQKMQSHGEKLVKDRKAAIKKEIIVKAQTNLNDHVNQINMRLPIRIPTFNVDFAGAVKGKKTVKSIRDAVADTLAAVKIEAEAYRKTIKENHALLPAEPNGLGYNFLFRDIDTILLMDKEHLTLLIKERISQYEAAEAARLAAEREKIRQEEERKAQAEERARLQAVQQQIANEERAKLQTEEMVSVSQAPETNHPCEDGRRLQAHRSVMEQDKASEAPVTIPSSEYEALIRSAFKLQCLENAGVDNWSGGYDIAMEAFREEYPDH